jgi:hypothetical protein
VDREQLVVDLGRDQVVVRDAQLQPHHQRLDAAEHEEVKNGPANAVYYVSLVQTPSGSGCNAVNANVELTTNGQGNGNIHVNVPEVPGTTDALAELLPANAAAGASGLIISQDVVF